MIVRCCSLCGWGMHAAFLPAEETRAAEQISKAVLLSDRQEHGMVISIKCHMNNEVPTGSTVSSS